MPIEHRRQDGVAVISLASPPVNAFGLALRRALATAFESLGGDAGVRAIVVHGTGKGFSAGGDKSEFGTPAAHARPTLSRDVLSTVERCGKPVVAAIHGFAVGGGLEFALACDARVAVADARVGLPEVSIGRFPLSGSQRLPRLLGLERAADWMMRAETMQAAHPDARLLFDRLVDSQDELLPTAFAVAQLAIAAPPIPIYRRSFLEDDPRQAWRDIEYRYAAAPLSAAQRALLSAMRAAVDSPDFHTGLDRAQVLFDELVG